jgi:hypothetical protein
MPTIDEVIASLNNAANAADDAYDAAVAADPSGDFRALHEAKLQAVEAAAAAIGKALTGDAGVAAALKDLDAATAAINNKLAALQDTQAWLSLLNNLALLAVKVGAFAV